MKRLIFLFFLLFSSISLFSQISHGGTPYSFGNKDVKEEIDYSIMDKIDFEKLAIEDAIEDNDPDIPWRFGKDIPVDINLKNSGTWDLLPNGDRIWRHEIISYGASSINLIYEKYHMPEGGKLFLYNNDRSHVVGSFTNENHKPNGGFATIPVRGESCILEYYEPASVIGQGELQISYVIHAYRDFYANFNKGFGSSGDCNVNVNCPEGDDWQTEKRGVAMILLSNNARKCSGSMINNTAQDGTPYFLTADHCSGSESTWIIMFNYESPECDNVDGPTDQSIQYTTKRAKNNASDFCLVELSEVPPLEYNVYYNGWNKVDESSSETVCIHHPRGDIKKISFDNDPCISDRYLGTQSYPDSHWKVESWDLGTTEGGSSGSPLFNSSKHIVGQLHGGWASCTSDTPDWFGKFSMSWDFSGDPDSQLMDWLDPLGLSPDFIYGFDPQENAYEYNAVLTSIIEPEVHNGEPINVNPTFVVRNMGNQLLESINVSYKLNDGEIVQKTWTGQIELYDTVHIIFNSVYLDYGSHLFEAFIDSPNGQIDEFPANDTLRQTIFVEFDYDIAIDQVISPNGVECTSDSIDIKLIVKNNGFQDIDTLVLQVQIDNQSSKEYIVSGRIQPGFTKYIILDKVGPDEFWHHLELNVDIKDIEDQNPDDNFYETDFTSFGNVMSLRLITDDSAHETHWTLVNAEGEVLEVGDDYGNNESIKDGYCLPIGCYVFTMYDRGGNGIQNDEGFSILNSTTLIPLGGGIDFGDSLAIEFCIGNELSSNFGSVKDTTCINNELGFINKSTGADTYLWYFEGGTPLSSTDVSPSVVYTEEGVYDVALRAWKGEESVETVKEEFITVINCTGLREIENAMFKIFPNPNNGQFSIKINENIGFISYRIINQLGEIVYSSGENSIKEYTMDIQLNSGMYILEMKTDKGLLKQRLLISK